MSFFKATLQQFTKIQTTVSLKSPSCRGNFKKKKIQKIHKKKSQGA